SSFYFEILHFRRQIEGFDPYALSALFLLHVHRDYEISSLLFGSICLNIFRSPLDHFDRGLAGAERFVEMPLHLPPYEVSIPSLRERLLVQMHRTTRAIFEIAKVEGWEAF